MNIKPFRFRLEKVSEEQNQIVDGLLEFLPATGARDHFQLAIRKALHQYIPDIRYYLEKIEFVNAHDLISNLPPICTLGVLGLEPFSSKSFVEIDPVLSSLVIDKLLGGAGEGLTELRTLTESEQGVIEFLLLKLLSQIHKLCGDQAKLHLRLDQMVLESAKLRHLVKDDTPLVVLKIHVALLNHAGFVNIYLPSPWVLEGFLKEISEEKKSFEHQEMKENLKHFENLPITLWSELGETVVSHSDLKQLEAGDVLLFDETGIVKRADGWRGEVKIFTGSGGSGGITALWDGFETGGLCRLTGSLSGGFHG